MSDHRIPKDRRDFKCIHCDGKISIPRNLPATTGPCPHCKQKITSPEPEVKRYEAPTEADLHSKHPAITQPSTATADAEGTEMKSPRPKAVRPAKPQGRQPTPQEPNDLEALLLQERRRHRRTMITILTIVVLSIMGGIGYYYTTQMRPSKGLESGPLPQAPRRQTPSSLPSPEAWESQARKALRDFLSANTRIGKLPHILNAETVMPKLVEFYDSGQINDMDTPEEQFFAHPLSESDHQRGLYRLACKFTGSLEQPALRNRLEAALQSQTPGPAINHLASPRKALDSPTQIQAFFMMTPDGLKLDWEVFVQTKFRRLLDFATNPKTSKQGTFRVLIAQDRPEPDDLENGIIRYRIADPANHSDVVKVIAKTGSEAAKALAPIHWVGTEGLKPSTRTATIELAWRHQGAQPALMIHRFLCWEFLGLGGDVAKPGEQTP